MNTKDLQTISEIRLSYISKIKASERPKIGTSKDAFLIFHSTWNKDTIEYFEEFKILLLNRAHRVLGLALISKGGITGTVIDIRLILQHALKANASALIACHNHPSGNLEPSESDLEITRKIKKVSEQMDIVLLDHLIIGPEEQYFSMVDEGRI